MAAMKRVTLKALLEQQEKIAVIGLGYVGLPLAIHLDKHFSVVGFDSKPARVEELRRGKDKTLEVGADALKTSKVVYTTDPAQIAPCRLIIVAVPTPIDASRRPNLTALRQASLTVGAQLRSGSCVVYESTVYPGVTEEVCVPLLEEKSKFKMGRDFTVGYSPERINPGDRVHSLETVAKIVSASDPETLELLKGVYGQVVRAGIHAAPSIKVAEAAKVIENTQRDINIALINELAIIFQKMGIDTREVLEAAGTKWNFLPFRPGLVGGHCIGVDPYYLTYKAESVGYHPEIILAGRRLNDAMGKYIAEKTVKLLIAADRNVRQARIAVLGLTFKENVPDLRNTRVIDIIQELRDYGAEILAHDPLADAEEARQTLGIRLSRLAEIRAVDAVIVAVAHQAYQELGLAKVAGLCREGSSILIDVKGLFAPAEARKLGIRYWRL